jgi:hypothetical protein
LVCRLKCEISIRAEELKKGSREGRTGKLNLLPLCIFLLLSFIPCGAVVLGEPRPPLREVSELRILTLDMTSLNE